jgi:FkbM family methyltransferase
MKLLPARLNDKPHYVFHPMRMVRRARYSGQTAEARREIAQLPWGLPLEVGAEEVIGFTILTTGVFDPCVTETMQRLIDPGDLVVDVGANVGYLTSLAAVCATSSGSVIAFEPHPVVFDLLSANIARWTRPGLAPVDAQRLALSDHEGTAELSSDATFDGNMGLSTLSPAAGGGPGEVRLPVDVKQLDQVIGDRSIGLLKIDVEGHEPGVLRGALELLRAGRVRDIIFEDHDPYPSEATAIVEGAGYRLYSLSNDLLGVLTGAPADRGEVSEWPGPSYLATRDPDRALRRLKPRGWQIKGIGPSLSWISRRASNR